MSRGKKLLFLILTVALVVAAVEAGGYALFYLRFGELPRSFGRQTFAVMRLHMPDHPYLPYFATAGLRGNIQLNSWGDRGPEPEDPKRRQRIICFGGSTTFDQEHRWEETWPGHLQRLLGEDENEVLIAAHNGDTTAETLVKLTVLHIDLQPDLILVYHGTNDLEASYTRGFRSDYAHRRRDVGKTPYPVFDRLPRWLDYSSVFVATRYSLVGSRGGMWQLYTRQGLSYNLQEGPFGLDTFERNLRSINAIAQENGARVVLGTFVFYRPWGESVFGTTWAEAWQTGIERQNDIIRTFAAGNANVSCADIARVFEPGEEHMLDYCHLKPAGNEAIARAFYEAIRRLQTKEGPT
jgi:lysophospholipase L1-like esterase